MKTFQGKTLEEVLQSASEELLIPVKDLNYAVTEEKKGLFGKKVTIEVYEVSDAVAFAEQYLVKAVASFGIEATAKTELQEDIIRITLDTTHNSILIGKNGSTLQALNTLVRLATSAKFKKKYRVLVDINNYKDGKYEKITHIAVKTAREVQKTHIDATLMPMTSDERRIVHNALTDMKNIRTESIGEKNDRAVVIKYVKTSNDKKPVSEEKPVVSEEKSVVSGESKPDETKE